ANDLCITPNTFDFDSNLFEVVLQCFGSRVDRLRCFSEPFPSTDCFQSFLEAPVICHLSSAGSAVPAALGRAHTVSKTPFDSAPVDFGSVFALLNLLRHTRLCLDPT